MLDGKAIQSMDNSFNGCEKLENVDLTEFEPKKMFLCKICLKIVQN